MVTKEISEFIVQSVIYLPSIAAVIGLVRFRHLTKPLRYLALLACFDAVMELSALSMSRVLHLKSNLFLFPIVLTGELGLLTLLYRQALQSAMLNKMAPWLVGLFGLYALIDQLAPHSAVHYAPGVQVVSYLLMLGMVWLYFRKLLNDLLVEQLGQEPIFLFSIGLTVYALGNLLIALFSNYILHYYSVTIQILIIHGIRNLFNVELYGFYIILLWRHPRK